jgi:hypothetical protein
MPVQSYKLSFGIGRALLFCFDIFYLLAILYVELVL